jgi:type VI secretion system secreted protein Hcp
MDTVILQFKDIKGNSLISGFADGILLTSFSHGTLIPMGSDVAGTERTLGRPAFSEFSCTKATDQSTPALFAACASGTKLGDATISIGRNQSGTLMPIVKYVLTNAMISNISTTGGGDLVDSISIHYSAITSQYTQQNVDSTKKGSASFGWDLSANKAVNAA